ncbi:MAG: hypothetical protein VXY13_07430, partial [Pseudomonadota bacterium]|nr:hypothetical protein [Pseudomonadota bacterium]
FLHALRASGSSRGALTIIYDYEHAYRPNPADATPARGMTAHFTAISNAAPPRQRHGPQAKSRPKSRPASGHAKSG